MSFIVRDLLRTSDGREIVRPQAYSSDRIVIGRDAASEIHLADLAVELTHAEMLLLASGRVDVRSVSGLGFGFDGRSTMQTEIDPAVGAELRFGSHRLRVSGDGLAVIVTVEQVSERAGETGLFTLASLMPSRRPMAWGVLATILLIFLVWPIYTYATTEPLEQRKPGFHADQLWSSGPLSSAHQSLANDCKACHTQKFVAVTDATCATCHTDDAHDHAQLDRLARAKQAPGFAASLKTYFKAALNRPEGRCVDCHTEHEGAGAMTPTAQAFCADCHGSLNTRLTDTAIANAGDFGTAHPQFRSTARAMDGNGLKFPHDMHLSESNGVARMVGRLRADQGWGSSLACKDCHTPTADGTRFKPVDMEGDCAMCHSLAFDRVGTTYRTLRHGEPEQVVADLRAFYRAYQPQRPVSLSAMPRRRSGAYANVPSYYIGARDYPRNAEAAIRAVFSQGGLCYDCHVVSRGASFERPFAIGKVSQPDRYFQKGWFDHDAHKTEDCASCHKAGSSKAASDLLLPDLASCRTCHVGEGGARLTAVKQPVESSCAMCHSYHGDAGAPWRSRRESERTKGRPRFTALRGGP